MEKQTNYGANASKQAVEMIAIALSGLKPDNQIAIAQAISTVLGSTSTLEHDTANAPTRDDFAAAFAQWLNANITPEAAEYFIHCNSDGYRWSWQFDSDARYAKLIAKRSVQSPYEAQINEELKKRGLTLEKVFELAGAKLPEFNKLRCLFDQKFGSWTYAYCLSDSYSPEHNTPAYSGDDVDEIVADVHKYGPLGLAIAASYLRSLLFEEKLEVSKLEDENTELRKEIERLKEKLEAKTE
jgi:hypothetical protein